MEAGGIIYATAGAGLLNEANQTNTVMESLLSIKVQPNAIFEGHNDEFNRTVRLIKQDIRFVELLDNVTVPGSNATLEVKGVKSMFSMVKSQSGAMPTVIANFSDGSPALIQSAYGKGHAYYAGFLPGLSYFAPAIPLRPVDRASVDSGMNHFIPTEFAIAAKDLLTLPLSGRLNDSKVLPVLASNPLVEVGFIQAPQKGTAMPCVNWAAEPLPGFNVTLLADVEFKTAALSSGNKVTVSSDKKVFTFDLPITADVLILR